MSHIPSRRLWLLLLVGVAPVPALAQSGVPVPAAVTQARDAGTRSESGRPGAAYWQFQLHYKLRATLEPVAATISGVGSIRFRNDSPESLTEIVLRLDQNRFRADISNDAVTRGMALRQLAVNQRRVNLETEVSGLNSTVVRVPLRIPVFPADSVVIDLAWDYEVPDGAEHSALRQGRLGTETFQVAQWYPRLAMYDDLGGWDLTPHEGWAEFFNPFGTYEVSVLVPDQWLVGATGVLQNRTSVLHPRTLERLRFAEQSDSIAWVVDPDQADAATNSSEIGMLEWRFRADSVNDFAWATSSKYAWAVSGAARVEGRRVPVHVLSLDRHRDALLRSINTVAHGVTVLSDRLTPYPWSQLTLVDGPEGGMEYPALTMSHGDREPHEVVHQWFPMTVGTDETRFNFLDEGMASFLPALLRGASLALTDSERGVVAPLLLADDLRTPRPVLGYGRGRRMLAALAARFGEDALIEALRSYSVAWRFKHPSPWDFMAVVEDSLSADLDEFWTRWLFRTEAIK